MPTLKPFRPYQVHPDHLDKVPANTSDFNSDEEIIRELSENPYCYLHMSKNHLVRPGVEQKSADFFQNAKAHFQHLIDNQVVELLSGDIFYVYRQTINGASHTGIIGLCDIEDYQNGQIRKHEHTKPGNEQFISDYIEATQVIGEPLLLSHHHKQSLEDLLRLIIQGDPDFWYEKGERGHQIWIINDPERINAITDEVQGIDRFYIMDGHHRAASVSNLYRQHQSEAYRYCVTFLIDANQLDIHPFHRLIHASSIPSSHVFDRLSKDFFVEELPEYALRPESKGEFVMRCNKGSYSLKLKQVQGDLDVVNLEEMALKRIFGIEDSRLDDRVRFVATDEELTDAVIESNVEGNYLFLLHPCTFDQIAKISDTSGFMPPKSTFVEPKSESGLFIQPYGVDLS